MNRELILASASPRRAELLRGAGVGFRVVVSPAREPARKPAGIPIELWPMCLAYMKAMAVNAKIERRKSKIENPIILGADTIVVDGERIVNKAANRGDARQILRGVRGKTHRVITGIALVRGEKVRLAVAEAVCRVRRVSDGF